MSDRQLWQSVAQRIEAALTARFGVAPARASVSFLGAEPIDVLRFRTPGSLVYCSLGMARHPMAPPGGDVVEMPGPRAELLIEVTHTPPGEPNGIDPAEIWKALAIFAAAPAVEGVVYAPGMTVDSGRTVVPGSRCTGALVVESEVADIPTPAGLVSVLQLLPATPEELAWARVHGVRELQRRFREHGVDLLDLGRRPVSSA